MPAPLDFDIRPGTVLAGKYRIEKVLGQGAMGLVVAARHLHLDENVAIKFLLPSALDSRETIARFEREAQAAAKIRSEHVARVRDVGRLESGAPYMVMEHLSGKDLKDYLAETGPLPVEEAIHYLLQASEALAEAHALGIVHRDLKPANMFRILRTDGTPSIKILDFGISKLQNADVAMTQTATMMGSPYYMSPEQMTSSKDVDARTDVWALGVILHQLLTGEVPFRGESIGEVCAVVLTSKAPRLSETRQDIPPPLQDVVDRALFKDREKRFANVAEFAQALVPFGQDGDVMSADRVSRVLGFIPPVTVRRSGDFSHGPGLDLSGDATLEGAAHTQRAPLPQRKSSAAWLLGVGGAVALLGVGALVAGAFGGEWQTSNAPTEASSKKEGMPRDAESPTPDVESQEEKSARDSNEPPQERATGDSAAVPEKHASQQHRRPGPSISRPAENATSRGAPEGAHAAVEQHSGAELAAATPPSLAPETVAETPGDTAESPPPPKPAPPPDPLEHYRDRR